MDNNQLPHQPDELVTKIKKPQKRIDILRLPVTTYFAIHTNSDSFDAVELDQFHRIYVYQDLQEDLIDWLINFSKKYNKKIVAVGLGMRHKHSQLVSDLWLKYDIVPYLIQQESHQTLDELIQSARLTASLFNQDLSVHPLLYDYNRVIASFLINEEDYKATVNKNQWALLTKLVEEFKGKKIRFFSATPQGGGVAIMRHALIRLYRALGVDATWHVLYDDPQIFTITKNKFHNVLQNVAPPETWLTDDEKQVFLKWSRFNAIHFKKKIMQSDVIVIDDPQPAGLVPYIKKWNPSAKLLYRSHIQIEAQLAITHGTNQYQTWSFISKLIKPVDVFISHPIKEFIPVNIKAAKVVTMPPTADPLDGLNKPLTQSQSKFYINLFNKYLIDNDQTPLDAKRPYIIQIARFDPSKGFPDVLESYRLLCQKMAADKRPQLVITGHGSIDDPDGIPILNYIHRILKEPKYKRLAKDIKVARLPHIDQPLNALLRNAKVCLQLSHKEGFEFKVTESLMKGVPVIAYNTGGIPLQIDHEANGFLVEVGNTKEVASILSKLLTNKKFYLQIKNGALSSDYTRYQTVANATRWLYLANQIRDKEFFGHGQSVQEMIDSHLRS